MGQLIKTLTNLADGRRGTRRSGDACNGDGKVSAYFPSRSIDIRSILPTKT
jgi:hypothetical protein